jgi:hypothetical protein
MADFRNLLNFCELNDLDFSGQPWTYDNKRKGEQNVKARIDRAIASTGWSDLYPMAKLTHVTSSRSDRFSWSALIRSVAKISNSG